MVTIFSVDLNESAVSYWMATMPVSPACRPVPSSNSEAFARSTGTASPSVSSAWVPVKATVTNCAVPSGDMDCSLVTAAATLSIWAPLSPSAKTATLCVSAGVRAPPSARLTTNTEVAFVLCGNCCTASFWAWADS